jgi:hypothetical protein
VKGIEPAKKIALISSESSDIAFANSGDKLNTDATANSSEPMAKMLPIHQFNDRGFQSHDERLTVTASASLSARSSNPLR